jgi:hypothetical protein
MNISVIITPNKVYATYHKTICYAETFDQSDYDEKRSAISRAKEIAFGYAVSHGYVYCHVVETDEVWQDEQVFNHLEKVN